MTPNLVLSEYYSWRTIKVGEIYKLLKEVNSFTSDTAVNLATDAVGVAAQLTLGRKLTKHSNILIVGKHYVDATLEQVDEETSIGVRKPKSRPNSFYPIARWLEVLESDQVLWIPVPAEWLSRREIILLSEYEAHLDDLAEKLGASYHEPT